MQAGSKHSPNSKAKMSASQQELTRTAEWRANCAKALVGRPVSGATREKLRQARLGREVTEETREKIRAARLGTSASAETRAKQSVAYSGRAHKASYPELLLLNELDRRSFRHVGLERARSLGLPISADILCRSARLLILVDGCHWHECPLHGSGKYPHKRAADAAKTKLARAQGWTVLRFWEHEILTRLDVVLQKIATARSYRGAKC